MNARGAKLALVSFAVLAVVLAGCSKSDSDKEASKKTTTTTSAVPKPGTSRNPIAFAYQLTGNPGTTVTVESTLTGPGVGAEPMKQIWSVSDRPVSMMLPTTTEGGTIRLEVTEGDSATLELVKGHAVDPADAKSGVKIIESLETISATPGSPAEVAFP